ncbi:hypothetical protein TcCL_NonESM11829, partial [Trypanosoma cruzi]
NNKKRRKATCQERWRYAVSARSPVSSCRAEAVLVAGSFHLEERLRQYFCEAQILHLPSVRSMIFSRHLHGLAAGWMRHVPLQTSFWIVSAMSGRCLRLALPCGGGPVRRRCGAESRMPDGENRPVVVLSGRCRRATHVFPVTWPPAVLESATEWR